MPVIDSLTAKLSFDFDGKALDKFNQGMAGAGKALAGIASVAAVAGASIFAFTSKIADQNDNVGKLAKTIGLTAQALNEFGFVAELNGGSVGAMNSSLEALSKISSEAAKGLGAGVEAFGLLGVSVTDANGQIKGADDLMLDVADAVSVLGSQAEKLELLNKLGIDSSLLLTLEQGSAAIRAQRKEVEELGFVLDGDAVKAAETFNDEMLRVTTVVKGIASAIGTKLMKQITPMIKIFLEWFKANKEIIKQGLNTFFDKLTSAIKIVFNIISRVVRVVSAVVDMFGGWKTAISVVAAAFFALNASILIMPAIILAVGAAIFLLIEDLIAFSQGADSQIGALAERFPIIGDIAMNLIGIFKMVGEGWGLMFSQGSDAIEGLILIFQDLGASIFNSLISPINAAISLMNKIPGVEIETIETSKQSGALSSITGGAVGNVGEEGDSIVGGAVGAVADITGDIGKSVSGFLGGIFGSDEKDTQEVEVIRTSATVENVDPLKGLAPDETNNELDEWIKKRLRLASDNPETPSPETVKTETVKEKMEKFSETVNNNEVIKNTIEKAPVIETQRAEAKDSINQNSVVNNNNQSNANSSTSSNTTNNEVTVNINGGDTEKIKQVVSEALGSEMEAVESNQSTEVAF